MDRVADEHEPQRPPPGTWFGQLVSGPDDHGQPDEAHPEGPDRHPRPEALELSVREGEVILRGQVDSRGAAETLPLQVRHVMGVVSVDAELTAWDPTSERKIAVAAHL